MTSARFSAEQALRPLRPFQRRTVDHVMRRLYEDPDCVRQFLVADEVGLGKTIVAAGVVARTIEHLQDDVDRIDVVYICSNSAIARQNMRRLNVIGAAAAALPTRMTMLPLQFAGVDSLAGNRINFVSLTPGTSFDLKSATGMGTERALILRALKDLGPIPGLAEMLRVSMSSGNWDRLCIDVENRPADETLLAKFRDRVGGDAELMDTLTATATRYADGKDAAPNGSWRIRNPLVARLRSLLSKVCVDALEPDLIILDEFQRFHKLLHGDSEAAELARDLFAYAGDDGPPARTLLLSATPYPMLTLSGDAEEGEHAHEFLELLEFLHGPARGRVAAQEIAEEMRRFRVALLGIPATFDDAVARREFLEGRLRRVIARTERVDATAERDAMLHQTMPTITITEDDLREALAVSAVARAVGYSLPIDYWKSAPFLLNFMRDYALKKRLKALADAPPANLVAALEAARPVCLDRMAIADWRPVAPPNARMRALADIVFSDSMAERLWVPPSAPYYGAPETGTKTLVFSVWSMVPDSIAGLLSYEAERRARVAARDTRGEMLSEAHGYFDLPRSRPIQFRRDTDGRLTGMRSLLLLYPAPILAAATDPLDILAKAGRSLSESEMRAAVAGRIAPLLEDRFEPPEPTSQDWEWATPVLLDSATRAVVWLKSKDIGAVSDETEFSAHVVRLAEAATAGAVPGPAAPSDLLDILTDLALGGPGVCALRALRRVAPTLEWDDPDLLSAAFIVAAGFRTLFNQPDAADLVRARGGVSFWRAALAYGAAGNLQAVLDEHVHMLVESEGLGSTNSAERVARLAEKIRAALSLRPARIEVDDPKVVDGRLNLESHFAMRGRFAMRLADSRHEEGDGQNRIEDVRTAFNSPFRPFVLASTSVGQEGLDFHPWCRRICHWNLPTNPVDLEQREGRVHRYKNHAVRLNIARTYGRILMEGTAHLSDPWAALFAAAHVETDPRADLAPWWIFEGPYRIERNVLVPPLSREAHRLPQLRRSVAIYRLAFGQPRQDDLLEWLSGLAEVLSQEELSKLQISLKPQ